MSGTFLAARLLFAMLFLGSGIAHFAEADAMTQYAQAKGVPQPKLATPRGPTGPHRRNRL